MNKNNLVVNNDISPSKDLYNSLNNKDYKFPLLINGNLVLFSLTQNTKDKEIAYENAYYFYCILHDPNNIFKLSLISESIENYLAGYILSEKRLIYNKDKNSIIYDYSWNIPESFIDKPILKKFSNIYFYT